MTTGSPAVTPAASGSSGAAASGATSTASGRVSDARPGDAPLLRVRGLTKHFAVRKGVLARVVGQVKAVEDVSFDIATGETLGLVGESGCGKTTAGRSILRLIQPTDGLVQFDGACVHAPSRELAARLGDELPSGPLRSCSGAEMRQLRRQMQIIFQDPYASLNPRMSVSDIVGEALRVHRMVSSRVELEQRVRELLARVGLDPSYINRYPHEFSGGQRQRIGIARALSLKPSFMVCDEAVSALDVSIQAQVINLLMDLRDELGISYLFVAHDLSVVQHISDRVAVMYLGRIVELGRTADIFAKPRHPYTQALLSAVPRADPEARSDRVVLQGDVPSPLNPPSGCAFHTRCPLAMDVCQAEAPPRREGDAGHHWTCHLED
ncbi:MAG: peptide ABC transporter substrate-binding protein [Planctomycetota bacterium]|nr:MAG: peptide ABC transporter substrate-binding protein [Planctomycetota bacterium]